MKKRSRAKLLGVLAVLIAGIGLYLAYDEIKRRFFEPTPSSLETGISEITEITFAATKLDIPWETVFLPEGDMLVTQRPGTIRRIGANEQSYPVSGVEHVGEGGLMGMALHPDFAENRYIYIYLTSRQGEALINRVERYRFSDDRLSDRTVVLNGIPGERNHDGGRIDFGPDGKLYVTTGDAGKPERAQDKQSLAGKILRINDDGSTPGDNPFGNLVYSYGHRNSQGIAWDDEGNLWSVEHGPSGLETGHDELNFIVKGGNYGWPNIRGDESAPGMIKPVAHSGSDETWAPAGLAYSDGSLFFAGLRGESLYEAKIVSESEVSLKAHLRGQYGRLRGVRVGFGGNLYVTTSNRDGRGDYTEEDDRIVVINPKLLKQ